MEEKINERRIQNRFLPSLSTNPFLDTRELSSHSFPLPLSVMPRPSAKRRKTTHPLPLEDQVILVSVIFTDDCVYKAENIPLRVPTLPPAITLPRDLHIDSLDLPTKDTPDKIVFWALAIMAARKTGDTKAYETRLGPELAQAALACSFIDRKGPAVAADGTLIHMTYKDT